MKKKLSNKGTSIIALFLLCISGNALAAVGIDVEGLIGFANSSNTAGQAASGISFGGRLGYHLNPTWEVGASFTTHSSISTLTILGFSSSISNTWQLILADINRHFFTSPELQPLYFGLLGGAAINAINVSSSSPLTPVTASTTTAFTAGARVGYDYVLEGGLAAGAEVRFAVTVSNPLATTFGGYLVLKYAF